MAERLDVAGRLAEGLPAVEHTQRYLQACEQVGYRHPDLTGDPAQIHDWYASEEGLDLHALDGDCAALRAAESVVTEALRLQRNQLDVLATAWTGTGADAAVVFLRRHCDVAGAVVTEVRAAAQRCESLRDNLWQLVDGKVATATAIDDRTLAQRPAWLAAAAAVTTEASAREVVEQQVKPYVDNDIRLDWRTAMLSTRAGITAAYDMVTDRFAAASRACFEIPGDFGQFGGPPLGPAAGALPVAPAAFSALPGGQAPSRFAPAPVTVAAPQTASALPPTATQPDLATGWPGDPGGSAGLGSGGGLAGLDGLAGRIVASMGDLLGSAATDPADDLFDEDETDEHEPDPLEDPGQPKKKSESAQRQGEGAALAAQPISEARPPTVAPAPTAPPAVPPAVEAPAAPVAAGSTPCEIAANELPQAGQ